MARVVRDSAATGGGAPLYRPEISLFGIVMLVALTLAWGTAWPAMKIVLGQMPLWTFRSICLVVGAIAFFTFAAARGRSLAIPRRHWLWLGFCAACNILIWQVLTAYALTVMPSGRAAIIGYTMPFWAVLLAALFLGERVTPRAVGGLLLGLAGLALLIAPAWGSMRAAPLGVAAMLVAAVCWGLGTVALKMRQTGIPVMVLSAWQVGLCAPPVVVAALVFDRHDWTLDAHGWMALAFVLLFAIVFSYWAWFTAVALLPASIAAIGMLATPAVGVWSGAIVLGETVGLPEIGALLSICAGLALVLVRPAARIPGAGQSRP
jgi:drug/metabolite transporter (DMT)-like permease